MSYKEKIKAENRAKEIYIDPNAKAYYGNGWQARHKGGKRYLNQFQRSKTEPEPMAKYIRRFDKKLIQERKNREQLNEQFIVARNAKQERRGWGYYNIPANNHFFVCSNYFGVNKTMNIPVVYEDETEGEFELELCCAVCAQRAYGWSVEQFSKVFDMAKKGEAIKLPSNVLNENSFKVFARSL